MTCHYCNKEHDSRLACPEYGEQRKAKDDAKFFGTGFMLDGKHVPIESVVITPKGNAHVLGMDFGAEPGRMVVHGSLTAYFYDEKLLRDVQRSATHNMNKLYGKMAAATGHWISAPRRWKRRQRILNAEGNPYKSKSRGWRKHVRKVKAKRK